MYRSRTTKGTSIENDGELNLSSLAATISALSARTRHVARRADTTLNGSKLAFRTSTLRTAQNLARFVIVGSPHGACLCTTGDSPPHRQPPHGDSHLRTASTNETSDTPTTASAYTVSYSTSAEVQVVEPGESQRAKAGAEVPLQRDRRQPRRVVLTSRSRWARLLWQSEHHLANNVSLHLRRAGVNRSSTCRQERPDP